MLLNVNEATLASEYLTKEDRLYLKQKTSLKVGALTYAHMPYWRWNDKNPEGINHDYATKIALELGLTLEYVSYNSVSELHSGLEEEEFDIALGVIETPKQSQRFLFSKPLHLDIPMFWFRDKSLSFIDPSFLHWGCIKHTYQCEFLKNRGYPNIIYAESRHQLGDLVKQNVVSAVLTSQIDAYYAHSTTRFSFGHLTYAPSISIKEVKFALAKSKARLKGLIDKVIEADKLGLTKQPLHSENSQLLRNQANISLWQTQQKNQIIRYTIEENMFPLSYVNKQGEINGYIHSLMQRIAIHNPMTFEYVPAKGRDVVQMLKDGLVDVLPARNVAGVDKRDFLLTDAYVKLDFAMITKNEISTERKLGILDRTGNIHSYINLSETIPIVPVYRTLSELLVAIDKTDVTHAMLNQDLATQIVLSNKLNNITLEELPEDILIDIQLAMVVRKDTPLLHSFLQASLNTLSKKELQELYNSHRKVTMEIGYNKSSIKIYALTIISLFLALTLLTVLIFGKYKRYKISSENEKRLTIAQVKWLNQLLNSIPNMIALFDEQGKLVLANKSYRYYLKKCDDIKCGINKQDCKLRNPRMTGSKVSKPVAMQHPLCGVKGQFFHVEKTNINSLDSSKQLTLIVYNDISELKNSEQKLHASNEEAKKAVQARSDFLAVVSHELRTPIAALMGLLDMVYTRTDDSESQLLLENAMQSADRLSLQVNDILDASKIEAEQLQLDIQKSNLIEELCPTLRGFEISAYKKELSFIVKWMPTEFIDAYCDIFRINQILNNLLSNALKFTESGKIEIRIEVREDLLVLEVIDTGCGMTPTQLSSIFKPFVQADNSITRRFGGSGLGMSIVKSLIDLMKGTINIRSECKLGTFVEVCIPIRAERFFFPAGGCNVAYHNAKEAEWLRCWGLNVNEIKDIYNDVALTNLAQFDQTNLYPDKLLQRSLDRCNHTKGENQRQKLFGNVLVVDDEPINRLLLQRQLHELGLSCSEAKDGMEALKLIETNNEHFDIIITDCHMPNLDGFTLAKKIRYDRLFNGVIIACTAEDSRNVSEKAKKAKFDSILFKPYSLKELYGVLAEFLPNRAEVYENKVFFQGKKKWIEEFSPENRADIALSIVESFSDNIKQLMQSNINVKSVAHRIKGAAGALHMSDLEKLAQQSKTFRSNKELNAYKNKLISKMEVVIEEAKEWL